MSCICCFANGTCGDFNNKHDSFTGEMLLDMLQKFFVKYFSWCQQYLVFLIR